MEKGSQGESACHFNQPVETTLIKKSPRLIYLALVSMAAGVALVGLMAGNFLTPQTSSPSQDKPKSDLFRTWPKNQKPELVLLMTGQTYGYLQPCGCSEPQYGGLERRFNFIQTLLKDNGWPVLPLDLGDMAQHASPQDMVKYKFTMEAMKQLKYSAVGVGQNEMSLGLLEALSEFTLNNPLPRVLAANLLNKTNFADLPRTWEIASGDSALKVAVVGVVASSVAKKIRDPEVKFGDVKTSLESALKELADKKPDPKVLLFEGSIDEAKACAQDFPQFQIIQCLTAEEEPPAQPAKVGNTLIVEVGHKGRCLGLVGIYKDPNQVTGFQFHYELIRLGPEYKTPPDKDGDNPMLTLLDAYSKEVKGKNYMAHFPRIPHPIQQVKGYELATYVGSEKCKKCHPTAYKVWEQSPHARAYASLEKATRPGLRQYDGECILCHVVGFNYQSGFQDEKKTPHLLNNGCENCHGPASLHVKNTQDLKLRALMNPFRTPEKETDKEKDARLLRFDQACQKCHDPDNDSTWKMSKWITGKIEHKEPKE